MHRLLLWRACFTIVMRIPYLNVPCISNGTCYHGQCVRVDDVLMGWYEFCLCNPRYSGFECNEQSTLSQMDWLIVLTGLLLCLGVCLCLLSSPFCYGCLKEDFYPQVIECARSTPYVELGSPTSPPPAGMRLYRIPSDYLSRRRTILDGLVPLHSISSLAYLTRHLRREPSID